MLLILHTTATAPGTLSRGFLTEAAVADITVMFFTDALSFAELWERCGINKEYDKDRCVLVITDLPETIIACASLKLPIWGYEHDGLRLSCGEIIESPENLTLSYLLERYAYTTGMLPFFTQDGLSLYTVNEDEYVNLFMLYRQEPYFLTETQRAYSENDIRSLYRSHTALASFCPGLGTYRVCPEGFPDDTVAYVSAFDETIDDTLRTTIDFYVVPECRGMGFGRRSVALLLRLLRDKMSESPDTTDSSEIFALVHPENESSVRTLTAIGFRRARGPAGAALIFTYDLSAIR